MLKDIGIKELIIQETADTKKKEAIYDTRLAGYTHIGKDAVETAMKVCEKLGMKVRLGLGFNSDWWIKNGFFKGWLSQEAEENVKIACELIGKYEGNNALAGWYIPHEFSQLTALNSKHEKNINDFFKVIALEIKDHSNKDIMIAPFYNFKFWIAAPPYKWVKMVYTMLKDTGIDIINLQDSVGAGYNTLSQAESIFSFTKNAVDGLGMKLYADIETFTSTSGGNIAAPQSRIEKQIRNVSKYVEGYSSFSIDHYQNKNEQIQIKGYEDYRKYYLDNK